jgi:hypothetical protein
MVKNQISLSKKKVSFGLTPLMNDLAALNVASIPRKSKDDSCLTVSKGQAVLI